MTRAGILVAAAFATSCASAELVAPVSRTRLGPANRLAIQRVVAMRASCGSLTFTGIARPGDPPPAPDDIPDQCSASQIEGVDAALRSLLEFEGYQLIDSERLNATTLSRTEVETTETSGYGSSTSKTIEVRGTRFVDATPAVQDAILAELGADGVLSARILVGAGVGTSERRDIEVMVRLMHARTGKLAWAARCRVEAGMELNEEPIERAARCAVKAAMER